MSGEVPVQADGGVVAAARLAGQGGEDGAAQPDTGRRQVIPAWQRR